jgi:hypothetical protein
VCHPVSHFGDTLLNHALEPDTAPPGRNSSHHFAGDSNLLAAWESASNVTATPRPDEKPTEGTSAA